MKKQCYVMHVYCLIDIFVELKPLILFNILMIFKT